MSMTADLVNEMLRITPCATGHSPQPMHAACSNELFASYANHVAQMSAKRSPDEPRYRLVIFGDSSEGFSDGTAYL